MCVRHGDGKAPEGWERGEAELSGRRKAVFYRSPKNPTANAVVVCTPVKGDYTSLGGYLKEFHACEF